MSFAAAESRPDGKSSAHRKRYSKTALGNGTSWIAMLAVGLALADPAHAACSDNIPANGDTVLCGADDPNPDENGVGGGAGNTDVTVDIRSGAILGNGNLAGRETIYLGTGAIITSEAGSTVRGGIRIDGDNGNLNLSGDVTSQADNLVASIYTNSVGNRLTLGAAATVTADGAGVDGIRMGGYDFEADIAGTVTVSGPNAAAVRLVRDQASRRASAIVRSGGSLISTDASSFAFVGAGNGPGLLVEAGATVESPGTAVYFEQGGNLTVRGRVAGGSGIAALFDRRELCQRYAGNRLGRRGPGGCRQPRL
ncbi:MAG: hypothetical protein QUV08_01745 [Parasphingorhabdus sp.]|nr:hypothetical protein [Parasphingorhabdus sp.]